MIYLLSFLTLVVAEFFGIMRDLFTMKNHRMGTSICNAIGSMLWCVKITIVVTDPFTIITAGLGAFVGSYSAFYMHKVLDKMIK